MQANIAVSINSDESKSVITPEHKPIAWIVAGVALFAIGCLVAAVAGPILALIAMLIIATVVIGGVLFLTESPTSLKTSVEEIKSKFEDMKEHAKTWKVAIIQWVATLAIKGKETT